MKTADLIPLILFELADCDKYGFELTKNIETKSNGHIIIKQPTLYTLLKKLEKSKFISSYWEDSEIGGKRHYYKITNNGRLQLSTLPSYKDLIRSICADDAALSFDSNEEVDEIDKTFNETPIYTIDSTKPTISIDDVLPTPAKDKAISKQVKHVSIMDALLESQEKANAENEQCNNQIKESILPSSEVFNDNSLDTSTSLEINNTNTSILKQENEKIAEEFAISENVSKFTNKIENIDESYKSKFNNFDIEKTIFDAHYNIDSTNQPIKYVEYTDFKKSEGYKSAKKSAKKLILKSLFTSLYTLVLLSICALITSKFGTSPLYFISIIIGSLIILFYPTLTISRYERKRLQFQDNPYKLNIKKKLYAGGSIFLTVLILTIIINICVGANTMINILSIKNFSQFYTPILMSTIPFIDIILGFILLRKINKN